MPVTSLGLKGLATAAVFLPFAAIAASCHALLMIYALRSAALTTRQDRAARLAEAGVHAALCGYALMHG